MLPEDGDSRYVASTPGVSGGPATLKGSPRRPWPLLEVWRPGGGPGVSVCSRVSRRPRGATSCSTRSFPFLTCSSPSLSALASLFALAPPPSPSSSSAGVAPRGAREWRSFFYGRTRSEPQQLKCTRSTSSIDKSGQDRRLRRGKNILRRKGTISSSHCS